MRNNIDIYCHGYSLVRDALMEKNAFHFQRAEGQNRYINQLKLIMDEIIDEQGEQALESIDTLLQQAQGVVEQQRAERLKNEASRWCTVL